MPHTKVVRGSAFSSRFGAMQYPMIHFAVVLVTSIKTRWKHKKKTSQIHLNQEKLPNGAQVVGPAKSSDANYRSNHLLASDPEANTMCRYHHSLSLEREKSWRRRNHISSPGAKLLQYCRLARKTAKTLSKRKCCKARGRTTQRTMRTKQGREERERERKRASKCD